MLSLKSDWCHVKFKSANHINLGCQIESIQSGIKLWCKIKVNLMSIEFGLMLVKVEVNLKPGINLTSSQFDIKSMSILMPDISLTSNWSQFEARYQIGIKSKSIWSQVSVWHHVEVNFFSQVSVWHEIEVDLKPCTSRSRFEAMYKSKSIWSHVQVEVDLKPGINLTSSRSQFKAKLNFF
jgi:hypothetical protein